MKNMPLLEKTHTDSEGNTYKVIGDKPQEYCVYYWNTISSQWFQDLGKDFSHLIEVKKYYSATQCKAPCGTVGTFLFTEKVNGEYVLTSPVFSSWYELSQWLNIEGFIAVGGLNGFYLKS